MKVLVHSPLTGGAFARFPLMLSMMQELLDAGHDVISVECDSAVPACVITLTQNKAICRYCMARGSKGRSFVTPPPSPRKLSQYIDPDLMAKVRATVDDVSDLESFKDIHYRGVDIGYAALSSYAHVTRDPEPDFSDPAVRGVLQRLLNTGRIVYEAWRQALAIEKPDRVLIFNGRLAIDRSVLRACQEFGVDCQVCEISIAVDGIITYDNALPQDIAGVLRQIDDLWDQAPPDREAVARAFYDMRRAGQSSHKAGDAEIRTNDQPYIQAQRSGRMPPDWDERRKNVVIYSSSDDEYCAISREWEESVYEGQFEALHAICRGMADQKDTRIYFRMHPRLIGIDRPFVHRIAAMNGEYDNLVVIPPKSPVSSYDLLDRCDVACTFRSTITVEAPYWGKPCIALANSMFSQLGVTYNPANHDEVMAMLRADLPPLAPDATLKVGYFRMRSGFKNPYYRGDQSRGGRRGYTFKGRPIFVGGWTLLAYRLARYRQRLRWA